MSKINDGELDQYGAIPFERQQFGTVGVERVSRHAVLTQALQTARQIELDGNSIQFAQL